MTEQCREAAVLGILLQASAKSIMQFSETLHLLAYQTEERRRSLNWCLVSLGDLFQQQWRE